MNIKNCFTSRFKKGIIVEADYQQLEVVGGAIVSGDENMHKDILAGVDSHSQSASWLSKHSYEEVREGYLNEDPYFDKLRTKSKGPRFQLQYGAGAASIAQKNGISLEEAKGFIEQYYARYAGLKKFQEHVAAQVQQSKFLTEKHSPQGFPIHAGLYKSITGRLYYFEEEVAPEWMQKRGTFVSFSPTKMKNYPIQGFATGDIVPEMLWRMFKAILEAGMQDRILMVNTIHDSILFDIDLDNIGDVRSVGVFIKENMEEVPQALEERWGIQTSLPFNVDIKYGDNWGDLHKLNL